MKTIKLLTKRVANFFYAMYIKFQILTIRRKDFTIICNTCIGGVIYHRLKMQFLSPTINMWMTSSDCIKFALNIEEYINASVNFVDNDVDGTPVAQINDIQLHFNHERNNEEALAKWNRRKKRINYDNLVLIVREIKEDNVVISEQTFFSIFEKGYKKIIYLVNSKKDKNVFSKEIKLENGENDWDIDFLGGDKMCVFVV